MQQLFPTERDKPPFQFHLSLLFVVVLWVALVSSLHDYPWLAAGAGAIFIIGYLHSQSLGRTTPVAAFAFVAFAIIAAVVKGFPYVVAELQGKKSVRLIGDDDISIFFTAIGCLSLVVAAVVAAIAAVDNRNEWFNHLR